jgi:hypothetical protein
LRSSSAVILVEEDETAAAQELAHHAAIFWRVEATAGSLLSRRSLIEDKAATRLSQPIERPLPPPRLLKPVIRFPKNVMQRGMFVAAFSYGRQVGMHLADEAISQLLDQLRERDQQLQALKAQFDSDIVELRAELAEAPLGYSRVLLPIGTPMILNHVALPLRAAMLTLAPSSRT